MPYFIRTEETMEDINNSLLRRRSLDGWRRMGKNAWYHLYASPHNVVKELYQKLFNRKIEFEPTTLEDRKETYKILTEVLNFRHKCSKDEFMRDITDDNIYRLTHHIYKEITHNCLNNPEYKENEIAEFLELEPFNDGYIKYLNGLCALQQFEYEPIFNDCTKMLTGEDKEYYWLKYLVCFEGDEVGSDIGDDWGQVWSLFKPIRVVWIKETNFKKHRNMDLY